MANNVEIQGLHFEITGSADKATSGVKELTSNLKRLRSATKGMGNLSAPFKSLTSSISKSIAPLKNFLSSLKRIAMYRGVRAVLSSITQSIKEGIGYLNLYSRTLGTQFHNALNTVATDALYMKSALASVAAPIVEALAPALDALADKVAYVMNLLVQLFAALSGKTAYTKAVKSAKEYADSISKAADKTKRFLLGIDELNIFDPTKGGGSGVEDFTKMFEEAEVTSGIKGLADRIRAAISGEDWQGIGKQIAEKLNGVIESVDVHSIGGKLGEKIRNAVAAAYGFLRELDFMRIGSKVADFINGAFEKIDFATIGRTLVRKFTALPTTIVGFIKSLNWRQIGKALNDLLVGAFNEFSDWAASIDWVAFGKSIYNAISKTISGIDFSAIAEGFFGALGSAFGAVVGTIGGFFDGSMETIREYFQTKLEDVGGSIPKAFFRGVLDGLNAIGSIPDWVDEHIAKPFVEGVKNALGIQGEDSTVMKLYGKGVSVGLKNGILQMLPWYGATQNAKWVLETLVTPIIDGIKNGFAMHSPSRVMYDLGSNVVQGFLNGLKSAWEGVKSWVKSAVDTIKGAFSGVSISTPTIQTTNGTAAIKSHGISARAEGGFVSTGELFLAREAGAEMVGRIGSRTTVANNDQIVEGISEGVAYANAAVIGAINQLIHVVEQIDPNVEMDGMTLARRMVRYNRIAEKEYGRSLAE